MNNTFEDLNEAIDGLQEVINGSGTSTDAMRLDNSEHMDRNEEPTYDCYNEMPEHSATSDSQSSEIPGSNNITEIESSTRFSSAIWYAKIMEQNVTVAGVGGIGSWVAMLLSRMNPRYIYLYDNDTIETVNLAGQFFHSDQIGLSKVCATNQNCRIFSRYYNCIENKMLFGNVLHTNILICGFDNMSARKTAYNAWIKNVNETAHPERMLFIDGRLNAEEFQVLCVTGDNVYSQKRYEADWLFDDSELEESICSYKQTSFMANMIASVMTNLFVNFCANLCNPLIERDVPFLTRYDGTTMLFKTE